jgi:hypothetical protein
LEGTDSPLPHRVKQGREALSMADITGLCGVPPHTLGLVSNQNISSCRKFSAQLYPQNATFQGWGCGASARELAQQAQGPEFKPQYCKEKKSKPCFNTQFTTHQLHPCLGVYPRIGQNANSELRWPLTPLNPNE